jgi:Peptidase family M50
MISLWLIFGLWIALFVHEFGHAFFGWLAGVRLKQIVLGDEPTLFRKRFGETDFVLNAIPDTAHVVPYFIVGRGTFGYSVFVAGGIFANAIACALLLVIAAWPSLSPHSQFVFKVLAFAQAIGVVVNAIPWPSRNPNDADEGSDGNQLWRQWRSLLADPTPYFQSLLEPYQNGSGPHEAPSWSAGLILDCRLRPHRWTSPDVQFEIFGALTRELERGRMIRAEEMLTLETLISDWFVFAGPATPGEVDQWSLRLLELGPEIETLKGTRGAVLTMIGRHEEGKAGLTVFAQKPNLTQLDQLLTKAFLAYANLGLGKTAEARGMIAAVKAVPYFNELPESARLTIETLAGRIGSLSEVTHNIGHAPGAHSNG